MDELENKLKDLNNNIIKVTNIQGDPEVKIQKVENNKAYFTINGMSYQAPLDKINFGDDGISTNSAERETHEYSKIKHAEMKAEDGLELLAEAFEMEPKQILSILIHGLKLNDMYTEERGLLIEELNSTFDNY